MKKPQLCFALSVSLALAQAPMLPGLAAPASGNIWQKMSGAKTVAAQPAKAKTTVVKARQASKPVVQAQSIKPVDADGQAMLFLLKGKGAAAAAPAPGAALTIHPQVADTPAAAAETTAPASDMVADIPAESRTAEERTSEIPTPEISSSAPQTLGDNAVTRLSPDALVAQGSDAPLVATPIPPVVTGTIDMEEFKSTNIIDLKVSQSRTFKSRNKIVRTSISDPSIAEPVVVAENQIVLLGKSPGGATMVLWDDAGNSIAVDLRVSRDYSQLQATLREIDPRIVVKAFSVGGSDRTLLLGDVDHAESIIRAFMAANAFMDDRGMIIQAANSRLINARVGEQAQGAAGAVGGQTGQLAQLSSVDKYTYFPNLNNNIARAQYITSDGGRVTSFVKVRKVPLIVLHCSFMEMNSTAARALAIQLGINLSTNTFAFGIGGNTGTANQNYVFSNPGVTTTVVTSTPVTGPGGVGTVGANQQAYAVSPVIFNTGNIIAGQPYTGTGSPLTGFTVNGIGQGILNQVPTLLSQAVLLGSPGSTSFAQAFNGLGNLFQGISMFPTNQQTRVGINPTVQGIITQSRARILTEPTLVTVSGERAAFLAGGEIPILQSIATAGTSQFSVTFEPFGIRLNMIPVLMENGNINLEVAPEERLISNQPGLALQFVGGQGSIPAFTTRKAQTIVEMKPGQELFI
ncbi:MAG: pilus assembly protein N-terminal domain-containing protein, partial [Candidatus Obscuribacterales bacterium]|nr:pilus assembly protein N-terminal domain-containing protein [Candidatus Obscuribacterales bacterium]